MKNNEFTINNNHTTSRDEQQRGEEIAGFLGLERSGEQASGIWGWHGLEFCSGSRTLWDAWVAAGCPGAKRPNLRFCRCCGHTPAERIERAEYAARIAAQWAREDAERATNR